MLHRPVRTIVVVSLSGEQMVALRHPVVHRPACPHSSRTSSQSLRRRDGGIEDIRCCIVQSEIESVVASGEEMAALRHPVLHRPVHPPVVVSVTGEETALLRECMRWADCVLSVLALKASRFLSTRLSILLHLLLKIFSHK